MRTALSAGSLVLKCRGRVRRSGTKKDGTEGSALLVTRSHPFDGGSLRSGIALGARRQCLPTTQFAADARHHPCSRVTRPNRDHARRIWGTYDLLGVVRNHDLGPGLLARPGPLLSN